MACTWPSRQSWHCSPRIYHDRRQYAWSSLRCSIGPVVCRLMPSSGQNSRNCGGSHSWNRGCHHLTPAGPRSSAYSVNASGLHSAYCSYFSSRKLQLRKKIPINLRGGIALFSKDSCALLTDLYQIKMAYGYWNNGHRFQSRLSFMLPPGAL